MPPGVGLSNFVNQSSGGPVVHHNLVVFSEDFLLRKMGQDMVGFR